MSPLTSRIPASCPALGKPFRASSQIEICHTEGRICSAPICPPRLGSHQKAHGNKTREKLIFEEALVRGGFRNLCLFKYVSVCVHAFMGGCWEGMCKYCDRLPLDKNRDFFPLSCTLQSQINISGMHMWWDFSKFANNMILYRASIGTFWFQYISK